MPAPFAPGLQPPLRFAAAARIREGLVRTGIVSMPREEGMALLDWLGFGRSEFGAVAARELAPRCRRRLWQVHGNTPAPQPALTVVTERRRVRIRQLLTLAEAAGEDMVMFG